jgi:hypothetical protein
MHYLRHLCLFACSGVQYILRCVFALFCFRLVCGAKHYVLVESTQFTTRPWKYWRLLIDINA